MLCFLNQQFAWLLHKIYYRTKKKKKILIKIRFDDNIPSFILGEFSYVNFSFKCNYLTKVDRRIHLIQRLKMKFYGASTRPCWHVDIWARERDAMPNLFQHQL